MLPNYETSHIGAPITRTHIHVLIHADIYISTYEVNIQEHGVTHVHTPTKQGSDVIVLFEDNVLSSFLLFRQRYSVIVRHIEMLHQSCSLAHIHYISTQADLLATHGHRICWSLHRVMTAYPISAVIRQRISVSHIVIATRLILSCIYLCIYINCDRLVKLTSCLHIKTPRGVFRRNHGTRKFVNNTATAVRRLCVTGF